MPRDGAGNYTLPLADVVADTTILAAWANPTMTDLAAALTASIAKDGQTNPSANLPMNGFKHTGVAAGSARTDYARVAEVQGNLHQYVGTVGGTANAITITPSPAITAYVAGQRFSFLAPGRNSAVTVNLNVSGLGNKLVQRIGESVLRIGDIPAVASLVEVVYDGTVFRLINAAADSGNPFYRYSAYVSGSESIPDNTLTNLTSLTEQYDGASLGGGQYMVIPETGYYRVGFRATLQSNSGNPTDLFAALLTNPGLTSTWMRGCDAGPSGSTSTILTSSGAGLLHFTALDQVSLSVIHVTGTARSTVTGVAYGGFSVEFAGP